MYSFRAENWIEMADVARNPNDIRLACSASRDGDNAPSPYTDHSTRGQDEKIQDPVADDPRPPSDYTSVAAFDNSHVSPPPMLLVDGTPGDSYESLSRDDIVFLIDDREVIFLIDDREVMCGTNWTDAAAALAAIIPVCTLYVVDGVDIDFLNNSYEKSGVKHAETVLELFAALSPQGNTPNEARLGDLLQSYMSQFTINPDKKPLTIICITAGVPTDPKGLENAILSCARELDLQDAQERQIIVEFILVGDDQMAVDSLKNMKKGLREEHAVRDMVDTSSWETRNSRVVFENYGFRPAGLLD
jgi:hypothetical protein